MEMHSTVVTLQPGMYILRHPQDGQAPLGVARAPGGNGTLTSLSTPDTHGTILRNSHDCIVLQVADAPVSMLVTAYLERAGDPLPALRLDQISLGTPTAAPSAPAAPASSTAAPEIRVPANGISLIGHVERLGDQVALPGKQLGETDDDLRLEGFQVMWPDRPDGVDLAYSIAIEGAGPLPVVQSGKFCGTRGAARRITEVTFSLLGPQARHYQLEGTASFSGGFQQTVRSAMPLSGPSGLEHLTALTLAVTPAPAQASANPWHASARTQVFKAEAPAAAKPATGKGKPSPRKRGTATSKTA